MRVTLSPRPLHVLGRHLRYRHVRPTFQFSPSYHVHSAATNVEADFATSPSGSFSRNQIWFSIHVRYKNSGKVAAHTTTSSFQYRTTAAGPSSSMSTSSTSSGDAITCSSNGPSRTRYHVMQPC
ncbi:hypothetical protein H310_01624 [Aphanomyces invadans]|uniref:Uncharacterized protein n=1 Tax=Aphanomyces invadans TaxID=157072 RepID=A0A024UTB5_9STRA|nr:hypothetical protein H310_01624 [Aphanomyces invadans]ETW09200.1 hypothetical protein H310_01624 [Aphanomyces invadans]|eukprot:XP_008863005.1 hypothetical protein H310_01624 [Aphanomyces invadans]